MLKLRYAHVLFDLDGTVYDSLYANIAALYDLVRSERPASEETLESLYRFAAAPAYDSLVELGFEPEQFGRLLKLWCEGVVRHGENVRPFDGVMAVISWLRGRGCHLGVITSRDRTTASMIGAIADPLPPELVPYFDAAVCSDDVEHPKPAPDSVFRYMEMSGAARSDILFIGDTRADRECARAAGVDFGLAVWGSRERSAVQAEHYFISPFDIINAQCAGDSPCEPWFKWAREIQAIGQIGLAYCRNQFDERRWLRLREIACEIMQAHLEVPAARLKEAFAFDRGYLTPKLDTRGAVFDGGGRILLVREKQSGLWNLPGGWCDDGETIFSNTVKEILEEAGMTAQPEKLIAIVDRNRHNRPPMPVGVLKAFVLCRPGPQFFVPGADETSECGFFTLEDSRKLELRVSTTTFEQLEMCFAAYNNPGWLPVVE